MPTKIDHTGHRERLRDKIRQNGLESLQPHEALEYLLFSFVPRRNTNDIAHRLLHTFGSFSNVLDAPCDALEGVEGMTKNAALFLTTLPAINTLYGVEKMHRPVYLNRPASAARFMCRRIGNLPYECFCALCLDAGGNLQGVAQFRSNSANSVSVNIREFLRQVLALRAVNVIVAHNHPSGNVTPSDQDFRLFALLQDALATVSVTMVDCFVVSGMHYYSFVTNQNFRQDLDEQLAAEDADGARPKTSANRNIFDIPFDDEPNTLFPIDDYDSN